MAVATVGELLLPPNVTLPLELTLIWVYVEPANVMGFGLQSGGAIRGTTVLLLSRLARPVTVPPLAKVISASALRANPGACPGARTTICPVVLTGTGEVSGSDRAAPNGELKSETLRAETKKLKTWNLKPEPEARNLLYWRRPIFAPR